MAAAFVFKRRFEASPMIIVPWVVWSEDPPCKPGKGRLSFLVLDYLSSASCILPAVSVMKSPLLDRRILYSDRFLSWPKHSA